MTGKKIYCPDCGSALEKNDSDYPQGLIIKTKCLKCGAKWLIQINWAYYNNGIMSISRII